ncbi:MAG: peroxidase family protein [Gemmatirosa sp.]
MRLHGNYPRDIVPPRSTYYDAGRFGRMFGNLPPFAPDTPAVRDVLLEIGLAGGIMDAGDDLTADPVTLITDPAQFRDNPDNPRMTAGMTFLGQFIDHDITFDPTSSLERQVDPEHVGNFRTPVLELDSLYGPGPLVAPYLFDRQGGPGIRFLVEECGTPGRFDLPRNAQSTAIIGDPRNDENLILSQLHLALLRFHNRVCDHVASELGVTGDGAVFAEAQRLVRWHYQWIIVHEFLVATCGERVVADVLERGRRFYAWRNEPFIPVEFSVAAYRFGHSQIRPSYRANFGAGGAPFFALLFNPGAAPGSTDPDDLRGGCRAARRFVDWPTFFDVGDAQVRRNKRIDTKLSSVLFALPDSVVALPDPRANPASLAQRNLLRHLTFALPAGQRVARRMQLPALAPGDLDDLQPYGLHTSTPLWFYVLREAEVMERGLRLGPVGARIVAEVLIGLLEGDRESYLAQDPDWRPSLPTRIDADAGHGFEMADLLAFSGAV